MASRLLQSYTLEPTVVRRVVSEADRLGVSRSQLVNDLCKEALAHRRQAEAQTLVLPGVGFASITALLTAGQLVATAFGVA